MPSLVRRRSRALLVACLATSLAGPASGVPGLVGDLGDDTTLEYLYRLRTFESLPDWPRYYFSDADGGLLPPGDDGGPCTEQAPCLSAAKMEQVLAGHGVIVVLDSGRWDDPADELAGWNGFDFDNSGCGSAGGLGANTMTDEPCAFLVPYHPLRPAHFDCEAFSGVQDMRYWLQTRGNGSGYLGVAGIRVEHCPEDADGSGTNEWGVHLANQGGGNGNLVAINLVVGGLAGFHLHVYRTQGGSTGGGHLVLINGGASSRDYADYNSDCVGPDCAPNRCTGPGTPYPCCVDAGGAFECHGAVHLWEINSPGNTLISNRVFDVRNTQFALAPTVGSAVCFLSDCENHDCFNTVIGPTCRMPESFSGDVTASASACYANLFPEDDHDHRYYLARTNCEGFPSALQSKAVGLRPFTKSDASFKGSVEVTLFQNTITRVYSALRVPGQSYGDRATVVGRCNLVDELHEFAGRSLLVWGTSPSSGRISFDFDASNAYDVDESFDSFRFGTARYQRASQVQTRAAPGYFTNPGWFGSTLGSGEGPLESGGEGVDGNLLTPAGHCAAGAVCDGACGQTLHVPLHPSAFVPSAATTANIPIRGFLVGTHHQSVGAPRTADAVPAAGPRALWLLALCIGAAGAAASRAAARRRRGAGP